MSNDLPLEGFIKALIGFPICGIYGGIKGLITTVVAMPKGIGALYNRLWKEPAIGPRIKTLASIIAAPTAIITAPIVSTLFHTGIGIFFGFRGPIKGVQMVTREIEHFKKKYAQEYISDMWNYTPEPLKEGKEPFDLSLLDTIFAFISGILCGGVTLVGATVLFIFRLPQLIWKALCMGANVLSETPLLGFLFCLLLVVIAILAPAAVVACSLGAGVGMGMVTGYKEGIAEALAEAFDLLSKANKAVSDLLKYKD